MTSLLSIFLPTDRWTLSSFGYCLAAGPAAGGSCSARCRAEPLLPCSISEDDSRGRTKVKPIATQPCCFESGFAMARTCRDRVKRQGNVPERGAHPQLPPQ